MARILLVEDNRDHLELMAYLLRSQGHVLLSAGSAESGRTMIQCCQEIDLIICDIRLGSESGIELIRILRKSGRFQNIPIVAVTAGSVGQAAEAFAAGFNRYILKPIDPEAFIAEINLCLGVDNRARPAAVVTPSAGLAALSTEPQAMILAVDDRPANLDLLLALLQPLGHRVVTARGVEEGLSRARQDNPDLLLTDVHMGDGTGFDLIRVIQEDPALRHIPWLVTSATYLFMDWRASDLHLDHSNFILQPWEPEVLLRKIQERLKKRQPQSAVRRRSRGAASI